MRDGSEEVGTLSGTCLVFAAVVNHRCLINKEPARQVARKLGISQPSIVHLIKVLEWCGGVPSQERLAVSAMQIPDATDADIAEWFGKPLAWAQSVRANAQEIKEDEYLPAALDGVPEEIGIDVPTIEQRQIAIEELQAKGLGCMKPCGKEISRTPALRQYAWHGGRGAFISVGT